MIIHDFDVTWTGGAIVPLETYAPLVIDSDAPLAFAVAFELFQPMTGEIRHVAKACRSAKAVQHHFASAPERLKLLDPFAMGKTLSPRIAVTQDHAAILAGIRVTSSINPAWQ
jgi:hypothetical protein